MIYDRYWCHYYHITNFPITVTPVSQGYHHCIATYHDTFISNQLAISIIGSTDGHHNLRASQDYQENTKYISCTGDCNYDRSLARH